MNKYTIYSFTGKPIKVIADGWEPAEKEYYIFKINGVEVFRMNYHNVLGMRKEAMK